MTYMGLSDLPKGNLNVTIITLADNHIELETQIINLKLSCSIHQKHVQLCLYEISYFMTAQFNSNFNC